MRVCLRVKIETFFARLGALGAMISRPLVGSALCLVAAMLVYSPALSGGLIWDDGYLVGENPFFRSGHFGWEVFRHWLFFDSFSSYYRPVQNWSYFLDYAIWRGDPFGYHLTNVLLHGGSGVLLWVLGRRIFGELIAREGGVDGEKKANGLALLVALVWTVHPVHNAAVAYISGRADSLASCLAMLAWLGAFRALESKSMGRIVGWGVVASGLILGGLCAKEIALLWLVLFLGYLFFFERSFSWRKKWGALGVSLGVLGIYAILHSLPEARAPMENGPPMPWEGRLILAFRALGDYTRLIFYPGKLLMERVLDKPSIYGSVAEWRLHPEGEYLSILGMLSGLMVVWLCRKGWRGQSMRCFGALWFLVAFLPISNLFPLNAEVAEHWIYLASIGAFFLMAGTIFALPERGQWVAFFCAGLAVVALGVRTMVRAGDWVDAETFCLRTIASGGGTPRIFSTLATVYGEGGRIREEEEVWRKLLGRFPEFSPAKTGLAACLSRQGKVVDLPVDLPVDLAADDARVEADARHFSRSWVRAIYGAKARHAVQDDRGAMAILAEASGRFPEAWPLIQYRAELLERERGVAEALGAVEDYAAGHWWHLEAWTTLGGMLFRAGQVDRAVEVFQAASRLDIYNPLPLKELARIEFGRGRLEGALVWQLEAVMRAPDQPSGLIFLGSLYEKLGRRAEAERVSGEVKRMVEARRDRS